MSCIYTTSGAAVNAARLASQQVEAPEARMALSADHQMVVDGNAERLAAALISRVMSMSFRDGLGSPEG
jgi:hypothetical protein